MRLHKNLPNLILSIGVACFAIATISTLMQRRSYASRRHQEIPSVISKVEAIEIVSTNIANRNEEPTTLIIEVRNNSDKAVVAIAVEYGDDKDSSGVNINGFKSDDEPPTVVIKPHDKLKIRLPLNNVQPGALIKVGGVMYLDGSEKGEQETLGTMRRQKEHEKKSKKGDPPLQ